MKKTKKIAFLTDAYEMDPSYSIAIIIREMLAMAIKAGYKPVLIVEDIFKPTGIFKHVEIRHIPSGVPRDNHIEFYDGWEDSVQKFKTAYDEILKDIDVIITHDLIYQSSCIWHNMAARQYAKEHPEKVWLNWVHSVTPSDPWTKSDHRLAPVQRHMPNSKTVYPNNYSRPLVAQQFMCQEEDVAFVPHPTDLEGYYGFDMPLRRFVHKYGIMKADYILVYPVRLDRGKQVEHVVRVGAALKRLGYRTKVIVVDFHSTGGDKVTYRNELRNAGIDLGLASAELLFTSQADDSWKGSVPRATVRNLFLLGNVFVMPSKSETYSLITQEAALCGNLLVLNFDFPPMRDIYGPHALYYKFSSNLNMLDGTIGETNTAYNDIDAYFEALAQRIVYEHNSNPIMNQRTRIRRDRNPDAVFKKYIEPLFHFKDGV